MDCQGFLNIKTFKTIFHHPNNYHETMLKCTAHG